jgi:hypothetical protein
LGTGRRSVGQNSKGWSEPATIRTLAAPSKAEDVCPILMRILSLSILFFIVVG